MFEPLKCLQIGTLFIDLQDELSFLRRHYLIYIQAAAATANRIIQEHPDFRGLFIIEGVQTYPEDPVPGNWGIK